MNLLETLPPPTVIQDRIGELIREERLLRDLLRLSMRAAEEREEREGQESEGQRQPAA